MVKEMKDKIVTIILGSFYLKKDENHILMNYYKKGICVANEQYEKKLFDGFSKTTPDFIFVSAPRVGSFPFTSKKMFVKGFSEDSHLKTVNYLSPYGFLNSFKTKAIIKKVKEIISNYKDASGFHLIACEAHRPYLETIKYFKKRVKDKKVFSTLIVPDLPIDMNKSKHFIYKLFKKRDVSKIQNICDEYVDSFLCFTDSINKRINRHFKKHLVYEGIIENHPLTIKKNDGIIHIVFIGKTDERNGIKAIIDAASLSPQSFIYDIYGSGDMEDLLKQLKVTNLKYHGFVEPSKIDSIIENADIMISPRYPNGEYINYSFPSKIFEYLSFRKKIVTYKLPCYFKELDDFLIYPTDFSTEELVRAINYAVHQPDMCVEKYEKLFSKYSPEHVAEEIIGLRGSNNE